MLVNLLTLLPVFGLVIVLYKELFKVQCDIFTWKHFAKLIFGINEGVSVKHIVDFYFNTDGNSTE